jgi:hypothetical protein
MSAGNAPVPDTGLTLTADAGGGFSASVASAGTYTFTYKAQNSQGTVSSTSGTITLIFPLANGPTVTVVDGTDKSTVIGEYRWIIEEDRTFYVDPTKTTTQPTASTTTTDCSNPNSNPAQCQVPLTFGTNFHSSHMPVIATGCTGPASCEGGQTIVDTRPTVVDGTGNPVTNPTYGQHINTVCDIGNGVCEPDTAGNGFTAHLPSTVHLDPTKRYYISVLPGDAANPFIDGNATNNCTNGQSNADTQGGTLRCGHGMGGAPIAPGQTAVMVYTQPTPFPPGKLAVFVFEDDFPLNGEQDGGGGIDVLSPNEPGLGGFNIVIFDDAGGSGDATGQVSYDMFNQPLSNGLAGMIDPVTNLDACPISTISRIGIDPNSPIGAADSTQTGITGTIVTCPKYESDGHTLSPLAGQAVVGNLFQGRYGIVATPGADRIARGEEWLQTNTLDGQKAHDSFLRIGEPSFFQEFGPAGFHVSIGFANPAIINNRLQFVCNGTDPFITGANCNNILQGHVSTDRMSRTPDERLYGSGSYDSFAFTQCYVSFGDPDGEDFAFTKCDGNGNFMLTGLPDGNWRVTIFDQWNDMLVDGLSTPILLSSGAPAAANHTTDLGEVSTNQWQTNIYTTSYIDLNHNGIPDPGEPGLALVATNNRFRDGSFSNFNNTDLQGNAGFNEIFPLFSWYVIETDSTRYANTGTHVVYDAGGPADTTCTAATAPCKAEYPNMANTFETVSLPNTGVTGTTNGLRVPGAVYCATADCGTHSITAGTGSSDAPSSCTIDPGTGATNCSGTALSTGRIDPPWVTSEAWQGFSGENEFIDFGKRPFVAANGTAPAENGGIYGHVVYASTRPFDDPQLLLQLSWEPLVPDVTMNLYQEITAPDGTVGLKLVDHTTTSSWDAWAQGFYPNTNKPYMNCPGQLGAPTTGAAGDLFFYSLYNQPMYLDVYNSGGVASHTIPFNSQFKCYDGMHNWNQVQPAPYDGRYQFPSIVGRDPTSGVPVGAGSTNGSAGSRPGTNCTVCVANPFNGEPMLPRGRYVVEVVVPPGYELVKEEDKNILIGDNFIAPTTVQFPGVGGTVYIVPDQASVAAFWNANQGSMSAYNSNNAQDPTQALGRASSLPSHEGDTGSVETFWPCVGKARVVPDYLSLFPAAAEVSPFAGATRNLCDRKEVVLDDQSSALAKFYIFTSTHVAAHFTGVITDDFTSEFDPFSPQFGEKFSPPNLPVAIKDWTGNEISRVYSDQWGSYNGLTYSTWEVNPPNPTGYGPTMMVTCMNDPGTGAKPDALYNPAYSQFCYEIPFMPGQTQYMDTPVVPTSAFASAGYNNPDCDYPDATPAVSEVDSSAGVGPWVAAGGGTLTIHALGTVPVNNYAYSGPSATVAPFNQKTVTRRYSFGGSNGTVQLFPLCNPNCVITIFGIRIPVTVNPVTLAAPSWNDTTITATVPASTGLLSPFTDTHWNCPVQQQAKYGGTGTAKCGQLVITAANGKQSIDAVTVTIGGKAPTHVAANASVQAAIDNAQPGDMLMIDPLCSAAGGAAGSCTVVANTVHTAAVHTEMLLMWKPVRLQGVGAASSVLNGNTHPAGETKIDAWRREVNCLFGLALDGGALDPNSHPYDPTGTYVCPYSGGTARQARFSTTTATTLRDFVPNTSNPQVDRLPLEAVVGWNAALNGNLAEMLQEPGLMGALEGATITVLAKGVHMPNGSQDIFGNNSATAGAYPAGTVLLNGTANTNTGCGSNNAGTTIVNPSNFYCNPASIDGLTIENSSMGGGGIFVHGWGHDLQIANNRVTNNTGTLSGGINIGQGEFPGAYTVGGVNADPGSCQLNLLLLVPGYQEQYCFNVNVNMHHNAVTKNSSLGDELFSATPAGAGGVSICNGADYYEFNYNWVCGNLSTGDGGGLAHIGFMYNGDIQHNTIIFNQSTNPTISTNGGGILVMGAPDADPPCGGQTDADCVPNPPIAPADGTGPGLVINANLIQGNSAESGSGGGLRLQHVNGTDVTTFPRTPALWYGVTVTNNIIANNVAGWDGGGISLLDALNVNIVNNSIVSNDTTASAGPLFNTLGAPLASAQGPCPGTRNADGTCSVAVTASTPQPAGVVTVQNSAQLLAAFNSLTGNPRWTCPGNHYSGGTANNANCGALSIPELWNNIIWHNRSFSIGVGGLGTGPVNQQNVVALHPTLTQPTGDGVTADGNGRIISGGTGACVTEPAFNPTIGGYWDLGVRGDTGPSTPALGNPTLVPAYSVISSGTYAGANGDVAGDPTMISQYCNGSRVVPENGGLGYNVPPGIADATVPNPIFNLTPVATVDEGNNWINMAWGPLSLVNTSNSTLNGTTLGNYGLTATSTSAINRIASAAPSTAFFNAAPATDFYGNPRKVGSVTANAVDAGAVEYTTIAGQGGGAHLGVSGGTLSFGDVPINTTSAPQTLVVSNTGDAPATAGVTVGVGAPFARPAGAAGGTCGAAPLAAGTSCTINIVFSPTAIVVANGNVTITSTPAVQDSPVVVTGNGVAQLIAARLTPSSATMASANNCNATNSGSSCALQAFTLTNTGNVPLTGVGTGGLTGAGAGQYSIVAALGTCGTAGYTTLTPGQGCVVTVRFQPTALGASSATLTVANAAVGVNNQNTAAISGNSQ